MVPVLQEEAYFFLNFKLVLSYNLLARMRMPGRGPPPAFTGVQLRSFQFQRSNILTVQAPALCHFVTMLVHKFARFKTDWCNHRASLPNDLAPSILYGHRNKESSLRWHALVKKQSANNLAQ